MKSLPTALSKVSKRKRDVVKGDNGSPNKRLKKSVIQNTDNGSTRILSKFTFESLELCQPIQIALNEMKMIYMTKIQAESIPRLLEGRDLLASAKTGSGKTLAFVVPALELLYAARVSFKLGVIVLVLTPTRELAVQIGEVARAVGKHVNHNFGTITGGANRKQEAAKLQAGVNMLAATPGRLLDHIDSTHKFSMKNLQMLIIDEADRMVDAGFERDVSRIISHLPVERQTCLFSATQSPKVCDLVKCSLKDPVLVDIQDSLPTATVNGLTQGYIVCPARDRLASLFQLLKRRLHKKEKVMVFFSSCASVQFHEELLNYMDLQCTSLHGKKTQDSRFSVYQNFVTAESGILLCTSIAARGLDIPVVDWIVQYDPPEDFKEYIHRVGRTARGEGTKGSALLFLMPSETAFLTHLTAAKVVLKEYTHSDLSINVIRDQIAKIVNANYFLASGSLEAYTGYLKSYKSHSLKDAFDYTVLNLAEVCRSFGRNVPVRGRV